MSATSTSGVEEMEFYSEKLLASFLIADPQKRKAFRRDAVEHLARFYRNLGKTHADLTESMEMPAEDEESVRVIGYLDRLCKELYIMPLSEILEIRREIRQHLRFMISDEISNGALESDAITRSLTRFGDADAVGRDLRRRWKRSRKLTPKELAAAFVNAVIRPMLGWAVFIATLFLENYFVASGHWMSALAYGSVCGLVYGLIANGKESKSAYSILKAPGSTDNTEIDTPAGFTPTKYKLYEKKMEKLRYIYYIGLAMIGFVFVVSTAYIFRHSTNMSTQVVFWAGWAFCNWCVAPHAKSRL
jgi:hypothetical protein